MKLIENIKVSFLVAKKFPSARTTFLIDDGTFLRKCLLTKFKYIKFLSIPVYNRAVLFEQQKIVYDNKEFLFVKEFLGEEVAKLK